MGDFLLLKSCVLNKHIVWLPTKSILESKYKSQVFSYKSILNKIKDLSQDLSLRGKVWLRDSTSIVMSKAILKVGGPTVIHYELIQELPLLNRCII